MAQSSHKVVVITGCSSGIGLDTAVLLAKDEKFKVIATMRNLQRKGDLEKAAGESLNKSLFIQELDVSKEESILKFLKQTYSVEGKIDVLINNAASGQHCAFEEVSLEQMQALFQTNFFGTMRITQEVVRKMKEEKSGHIIFISSIAGVMGFPFSEFYVASKFAVEGLVNSLAPVLRGFNVSVTSVEPGPVQTAFVTNIKQNQQGGTFQENDPDLDSKVDHKTAAMRQALLRYQSKAMVETMQSGLDVAEIIKKCIYEKKPPVRIQTSPSTVEIAKGILVDPSGEKDTEGLYSLLQ
ncbi:Retinol dehydrogenase 8 [Holothuria leucospilota]|uniref:Retinol dehydrogenase 8 n=1 Tax=Holothuria leucospilota TaxID=206669 RepID=A0A9Q1BWE9_HOLLE|nr:Retinol dehydrogenase 8 [Holothuria leucospilota]